jgi:hypothetical protein
MTAAGNGRVPAGPAASAGRFRSAAGGLDFGVRVASPAGPGEARGQERQMLTLRREDGAC